MASKHTRSIAFNTLASLLSVALAGCAHSQTRQPSPDTMNSRPLSEAPVPATAAVVMPQLLVDAAKRSGVPQDRLRVVRAVAVTWPDSSLGCPQPGLNYTQALVPGWQVFIAASSAAAPLQYHGSNRGGWVHCPPGRASPALPATGDPRI